MNVNDSKLVFNIQTLVSKDGKSIKSIHPDKDGIIKGMPLAVLGKASRNKSYYEENSFINAMTNPDSAFYRKLTEGGLEGEMGHPFYATNTQADIKRIMYIDRTKVSHGFTRIYSQPTEDGKYILILGDVLPCGPYKRELLDSFEDPNRNTAFSLRSLTSSPQLRNGVQYKKVLALITFDAVETGGYEEASKRFMASNECLEFKIPTLDFINNNDYKVAVGFENLDSDQLFDMLGTDKIILENKTIGIYNEVNKNIITSTGSKSSIFHTMYN